MDCLAQVKRSRTDFHFYLIGDGPDRAALEAQIKQLGLDGFVTLLGNQANPFCYMAQIKIPERLFDCKPRWPISLSLL